VQHGSRRQKPHDVVVFETTAADHVRQPEERPGRDDAQILITVGSRDVFEPAARVERRDYAQADAPNVWVQMGGEGQRRYGAGERVEVGPRGLVRSHFEHDVQTTPRQPLAVEFDGARKPLIRAELGLEAEEPPEQRNAVLERAVMLLADRSL